VIDKNLERKMAYKNAENKAQEVIVMLPVLICLPLGQVQTDAVLVDVLCMLGSNDVIGEICEEQENMFDEMLKRKFKLVNIFVLASIHMKLHLQKYFVFLKHRWRWKFLCGSHRGAENWDEGLRHLESVVIRDGT
jgi:hypothetical protein